MKRLTPNVFTVLAISDQTKPKENDTRTSDSRVLSDGLRKISRCASTLLELKNYKMPTEEPKAGASKPENLDQAVPTPRPGAITRSFSQPATPASLPRNVCSTGSGRVAIVVTLQPVIRTIPLARTLPATVTTTSISRAGMMDLACAKANTSPSAVRCAKPVPA